MHLPFSRTRAGRLRRRVRAHNFRVLGSTIFAVVVVIVLWIAAYAACYWLVLLFLTSVVGPYARMPARFSEGFGIVSGLLLAAAWVIRWLHPHPRPPDKKGRLAYALDFLLTLPRLTLGVGQNLSAWQSLRRSDLPAAVQLVDRVREVRKMPLHSLPVEIPDQRRRDRVVEALLQLHLLELGQDDRAGFLRLAPRDVPTALDHFPRSRLE
jgi:hypothetical protein